LLVQVKQIVRNRHFVTLTVSDQSFLQIHCNDHSIIILLRVFGNF